MQDPITDQTIERFLYALAYRLNWERVKPEFQDYKHTEEVDFVFANNDLKAAYLEWHQDRDALQTLIHLENARVICNERFYPAYLTKYNTSIAFLQNSISRANTPIHDQGAQMENLLQRIMLVTSRPPHQLVHRMNK
jgi:hypothetical protein